MGQRKTLYQRFRQLSPWSKLGVVAAIATICSFLLTFFWPTDSGKQQIIVDADSSSTTVFQAGRDIVLNSQPAPQQSPKDKSSKDSTPRVQITQTMVNSPGAIQAGGDVIQYNEKPLPPLRTRTSEILKKINPAVLTLLRTQQSVCVCINQINLGRLLEEQDSLRIKGILRIQSTGSVSSSNTNQIGNCINDLTEGFLNCYLLTRLQNFNRLFPS